MPTMMYNRIKDHSPKLVMSCELPILSSAVTWTKWSSFVVSCCLLDAGSWPRATKPTKVRSWLPGKRRPDDATISMFKQDSGESSWRATFTTPQGWPGGICKLTKCGEMGAWRRGVRVVDLVTSVFCPLSSEIGMDAPSSQEWEEA